MLARSSNSVACTSAGEFGHKMNGSSSFWYIDTEVHIITIMKYCRCPPTYAVRENHVDNRRKGVSESGPQSQRERKREKKKKQKKRLSYFTSNLMRFCPCIVRCAPILRVYICSFPNILAISLSHHYSISPPDSFINQKCTIPICRCVTSHTA